MKSFEPEPKVCTRCGHIWESYAERPVRCPGCGTYHWDKEPVTNVCAMCGHKWFSRTTQVPVRCPSCKTRSWKGDARMAASGVEKVAAYDFETGDVAERYCRGQGCVRISMETGMSLERVIRIVRSENGDDRRLRM
ncbi:MAG: hypothetical protein Q4Q58_02310 [Thermoplasmata archaeon]|nr:hypothetical protein [Thermoplasmata archaeon]